MHTTTAEEQILIVNFLSNTEKTIDWRYQTYDKLSMNSHKPGSPKEKTIYWMGMIPLLPVRSQDISYGIQFADWRWNPIFDQYERRDVDGFGMGGFPQIKFNMNEVLMLALINAREAGDIFFHVLLEETVESDGTHEINLLYKELSDQPNCYGIATKVPWFQEPVKEWVALSSQKIDESTQRICLVSNPPYRWLK